MAKPLNGRETGRDAKTGRFLPGNKGGGRKPTPDSVKMMLQAATEDAAKLLIQTIHDENAKLETRLDCAKAVMDRVYGKATQPLEGNMDTAIRILIEGDLKEYAG